MSIVDVDEWEAEYLLIAENVERRGQAETDPMKKSRIGNFLREYWDIQRGGDKKSEESKGHNGTSISDIAETIGETERTTKRILKLNDLIPEIQQLVSSGKLGTTAAEQLAYLSSEEQKLLFAYTEQGTPVSVSTTHALTACFHVQSHKIRKWLHPTKTILSDSNCERLLFP